MKKVFMVICLVVFVLSGISMGDIEVNTQQTQDQDQSQSMLGNGNTSGNNQSFSPTLVSNSKYHTAPIMIGLPSLVFDFPKDNGGTFYASDFHGDLKDLESDSILCEDLNYILKNTGQFGAELGLGFKIRKNISKKYSPRISVSRYFDVYRSEIVNPKDWVDRRELLQNQGYICLGSVSVECNSGYMTEHSLAIATKTAAKLGADVVLFRFGSKPIHHGKSVGIGTAPVVSNGENTTIGSSLGFVSGAAEVLRDKGAYVTLYRKVKGCGETIFPIMTPIPQIEQEGNKDKCDKEILKDAVKASSKAPETAEEKPVIEKVAKTVG